MRFRFQPVMVQMEFVFDDEALPTRIQFRTQELCTVDVLRAMYTNVLEHRQEGDPAPKDVILEALAAFQPERVDDARATLEALEQLHLEKVLVKMGGRLS